MKEQLIKLDVAKLAKEKGFDIPCKSKFTILKTKVVEKTNSKHNANSKKDNVYSRPTQGLLQKGLREIYDIHVEVFSHKYKTKELSILDRVFYVSINGNRMSETFESFEAALEKGLKEGLKIIK